MTTFTEFYNRKNNGAIKWQAFEADVLAEEAIAPMTIADMDFQMSPYIKEALKSYTDASILGYSKPTESYLNAVKSFLYKHYQFDIQTDWLVTTPGIVNALSASVRAFSKPGDAVLMLTPVYNPFYEVTEGQGRRVVACPLLLKDNRYEIDFDLFEKRGKEAKVKILFLCSPHNPGGRVWTREELNKIIDIALKNDLKIVSDEIHADLTLNDVEHHMLPTVNEAILNHSVICTAASKSFNIAGLQCSNIIIPNPEMRDAFLAANLAVGVQGANVLGMVATEAAYRQCGAWLKEVKALVEKHQAIVVDFFEKLDTGFKVMRQDASFLAWINFANLGVSHKDFLAFLNEDCHLYVNDGLIYGESGGYFIRMNIGLPTQALKNNLAYLKKQFEEKFKNHHLESMQA